MKTLMHTRSPNNARAHCGNCDPLVLPISTRPTVIPSGAPRRSRMKSLYAWPAAALALLFTTLPGVRPAFADAGHDHDGTPAAAVPVLPRFATASETFELVGVRQGNEIVLYLD